MNPLNRNSEVITAHSAEEKDKLLRESFSQAVERVLAHEEFNGAILVADVGDKAANIKIGDAKCLFGLELAIRHIYGKKTSSGGFFGVRFPMMVLLMGIGVLIGMNL